MMIKKYKILGLDCPNCAKSLEKEINKQPSIKKAEINFVKEYITIDSHNQKQALAEAIKVASVVEPDAKIVDTSKTKNYYDKSFVLNTIFLVVGLALAVVTLTVKMPKVIFWIMYVVSALLVGYKTYYKAITLLFKGTVNENLLVTISIIGAVCVGEYMEGLMVIGLYSIGKLLESLALNKSKKSIEALTNIKPEYVTLLIDGEQKVIEPNEVKVDDLILVKPGERIPLDGVIVDGSSSLNMQSLTGESIPVFADVNSNVLSGSIVLDGTLTIKVTSTYAESTVSKILNLIENAQDKKSKTETVISKIAKWYTYAVMALAVIVFCIVWLVTKNPNTAIYRGLIFLVVSCPCAFAISVPLSYFSGLGNASKNGILIKGSNYLDALTKVKMVAFDKTGTLTTGEFAIDNIEIYSKDFTKQDIIYIASLGEQYSIHPLAKAILKENNRELSQIKNVKEVAGEGVYFAYNNDNYFVGKKDKTLTATVVEVYKNNEKIADIYLSDTIKETSKTALTQLKNSNIKTVLLSGDKEETVKALAEKVNASEYYYNLLPEDKYKYIEEHKQKEGLIAYVGDGINDAPALTLADIGISMGINGSGASIEASDIVLVDDNPNKVNKAISISRFTRKIVWENILFSLIVKVLFLTLGAFGITGMLSAVIADVGVTVIAILNSLRALYSNNEPHKHNIEQKQHNHEHHKECCCADHDHKECDCKEDDCDNETENHHKHESCHCEHNKIHNDSEHKCCCNKENNNKKDN
ncbi:MAG: heavy metal translocating P-type ATPase [Eubacteriales bacterium]|nr:heavy metal translocating P-type ATPase [Eubacteriales bacterium]